MIIYSKLVENSTVYFKGFRWVKPDRKLFRIQVGRKLLAG